MSSIYYNTFDARSWHRRVLSRSRSALATRWNRYIYEPFQILTRTLIRWLYGPKPPLFVHDQMSAEEISPASPLPLTRKRRLSITEFTLPGQSRTVSTHNQLFSKLTEILHIGTTSTTPPETSALLPRFHETLAGRNDVQYTATQDQCPLFTKLPLELRLQIYGHVLGYRTLHIILSHVPSLTLPPRFSFRTYIFHQRLDFEICKIPGSHLDLKGVYSNGYVVEGPEICTEECMKEFEFACLIRRLNDRKGTQEGVDETLKIQSLLRNYKRKNGPLALLKTCRIIYSEAIKIIYTTNTFSFFALPTFLLFPTLLSPSRLPNLRHLTLHFAVHSRIVRCIPRYKFANTEWPRACAFLRTLPSLHTLTISLAGPMVSWTGSHSYRENESPLEQLSGVEVKGEFVVLVGWPATDFEKSLETEFGMRLLVEKSAVERWKEISRRGGTRIENQ